jgi:hypothetical protein
MPFGFKKKVLTAMITASLLYGCESWLTHRVKEVEKLYIAAVKSLLGVRETTRTDTALIESGMPAIGELIKKRTSRFLKKELLSVSDDKTPLAKIYDICKDKRTNGYKYVNDLMTQSNINDTSLTEKFATETGTKAITYKKINPTLGVHKIYTSKDYISERARLSFTRFRLSSHNLKVEPGRWARIDREDRLCECGGAVQDEHHVLFDCPMSDDARRRFGVDSELYDDVGMLMDNLDVDVLVSYVDCCMKIFK